MPLDPSISLNSQFSAPSVNAMAQGAGNIQQIQQQQQAIQAQNQLRALYANQDNMTDDGQLKPNALKEVYAIDPKAGMAVSQNQFKMQQQQMNIQMLTSKQYQQQMEFAYKVKTDARLAYENALQKGLTPDAAQKQGQDTLSEGIESMQGSGLFSAQHMAKVNPKFDPNSGAVDQDMMLKYQKLVADQQEKKQEFTLKAGDSLEKQRHDRETEALGKEKLDAQPKTTEQAALKAFMKEHPDASSDDLTKFKQGLKKDPSAAIDDDTAAKMAQQYLTGDTSVMSNIGRGAQAGDNIAKVRRAIYAEADKAGMSPQEIAAKVAEFGGLKAGERTLGTRTAQIGMAVSEAQKVAPLALAASAKVNRTDYPSLNSVLLAAEKGTGGEDVARFSVATNSLINIYSRAISPTGTATVSDKDHAREILSSAWSKGQYSAAVDQMMQEMNAAAQAPGTVRKEFKDAVSGGNEISDAAGKVPTSASASPPVSVLKKGIRTKFSNGEVWTLGDDGQARKIN